MSDYFTTGFIRDTEQRAADDKRTRTQSWHGLGEIVELDEGMGIEDIRHKAGWNWETELVPCFCTVDGVVRETERMEVIRSDTRKSLGNVGKGYTPLQPSKALEAVRPWIEAGEAIPQSAGTLKGGVVSWLQLRLDCDPIEPVKGDVTEPMFLFTQGHNGTSSVNVGLTPIRVVCWNTLRAGLRDRSAQIIRIIHRKNVVKATESVIGSLDTAKREFLATGEKLAAMARMGVNSRDLDRFFRLVVEAPLDEELKGRKRNMVEELKAHLELAPGGLVGSGTLYAALNAVTYHNTHKRGTRITEGTENTPTARTENRLYGLWFGTGNQSNARAWALAEQWIAKGYLAAA